MILCNNNPILLGDKCKVCYYLGRNLAILSRDMKPRKPPPDQDDLLRARLVEMIDMRHELERRPNKVNRGDSHTA